MTKDIYKDAYQREMQARKAAEQLLDEKTRALYDNVLKLEETNQQLAQQTDELNLLIEVANFTQQQLSFVDGLSLYLPAVARLLNAKWGMVYLTEKKPEMCVCATEIRYTATDVFPSELCKLIDGVKFKMGQGLPGIVLEQGELMLWHVENNAIEVSSERLSVFEHLQAQGALTVPIKRFGDVVAVAEFVLDDLTHAPDSTVDKIKTASLQLGVALERRLSSQKLKRNYAKLKEMHQQLKQAQNQLVQSEKMSSLGQIAAGMAHEINNPIGFVTSNMDTLHDYCRIFTQLIQRYKELEKVSHNHQEQEMLKAIQGIEALKAKEDIDFIIEDLEQLFTESLDGLHRTREIVANLKSFARVDSGEQQEVDLNECLENTLKIIWNELKYTIELKKDYGELPPLKCNGGQLSQVFMNIIMNARDACGEKGQIEISTGYQEPDLIVKIKDNGCGIPKAVMEKIFDPFFTTKPVGSGTGLGMSISFGIIEQHKGRIEVDSEEGIGTTFTIILPTN